MSAILLRHASAGDRNAWDGDDRLRPLDDAGYDQAIALPGALAGRGIARIVSSPYLRCIESVEPLAAALGLTVELDGRLAEGADRAGALALLVKLDGGLACTHGDIVEAVLGRVLEKGAAAVVELAGGDVRVLEELQAL
jgi:phosphohistidine phosphatase SixA